MNNNKPGTSLSTILFWIMFVIAVAMLGMAAYNVLDNNRQGISQFGFAAAIFSIAVSTSNLLQDKKKQKITISAVLIIISLSFFILDAVLPA